MSIPNEIWMNIFELLESPKDLASVVRSTRHFKSLGIRALYRHIIWSDPSKFVKNHTFLLQNTPLHFVARALTLGISTVTPHLDRVEQISRASGVVQLSGEITRINRRFHETRVLDDIGSSNSIQYLASEPLADAMYTHINSFTNLRELTFSNMVLPDCFYHLVHRFPLLDKLAIEGCTAPFHPHRTHLHPRDLPITQLSIMGLRGRRDPRDLRAFGEAQRLQVVRFDWTCYIFKHFSESANPPNNNQHNNWVQGFVVLLPPGVNALQPVPAIPPPEVAQPQQPFPPSPPCPVPSPHIHTVDVKFPTQKSWQSYVSEPHDQLINPFSEFLEKCPRLANLRIRNYLPWLLLPDNALPNLAYYQGPLTTIRSIVSGSRRPKHLTIRDPAGGISALEKSFKEIDAEGGTLDLETLSVFIGWWDDEILYAVLHHFRGLKRLEIIYKEGDPTEEMVLGMGAHFFGRMPRLWSVRVFKVIPPGVDTMADKLTRSGFPQRSQLAIGEDDGFERVDLDDPEFEDGRLLMSSVSSVPSLAHSREESEEVLLKELIHAWNRYCPQLKEVQLKAGHVWRRAGPDDVWTQRPSKVSRLRNAGFEEV